MNSTRFLILAFCLLTLPLFSAPPPYQRNVFTTNSPGTVVGPPAEFNRINLALQAQAYATNFVMDFANPQINEITLTNNINFISTNRAAGRSYSLRVNAGGESAWTLAFPSWHFLGGVAPTSIAQGRVAKLVIECYGTSETNIVAGWAVEP